MKTERSAELMRRARTVIPGGVNSPVRAFRAVGGTPPFISRAEGAYLWDVDGNRFIDYVGSWGPMILGHAAPEVVEAAKNAIDRSSSFGAPTEGEVKLAELVKERIPSVDRLRLTSSGTEACMSAIRVARGFTKAGRHPQVRGLLPRPRRLLAGQSGLRGGDLRPARLAGRPRRLCQAYLDPALQ